MSAAVSDPPLIELRGIGKTFGKSVALSGIDMIVEAGTVHCLVGENGAGKSTVGKIIAGVHAADSGQLLVDGVPVRFGGPHDALSHGIALIAQELALLPARSVEENIFLGREPNSFGVLRRGALRRRCTELIDRTGFTLRPDTPVRDLRPGQQMEVEILRALSMGSRLIVMDEPTAALTEDEAEHLFTLVRELRLSGTSIVYVSHRLREILDLADRITIFRDGTKIRTATQPQQETETSLITSMLGSPLESVFPAKLPPARCDTPVLSVRQLASGPAVRSVSFDVNPGEIVALAGLVGSGRSETAHAVFGSAKTTGGEILIDGEPVRFRRPGDAIARGVALLPESRKTQGLVMTRTVEDNVVLAQLSTMSRAGFLRRSRSRAMAADACTDLDIRTTGTDAPVCSLSGGNQQKVLLGRWLATHPRLLIVDEPTHGVDVGAKATIYRTLTELAAEGCAIVLISADLVEVLGLAHRVVVLSDGVVVAELGPEATEEQVLAAAFDRRRAMEITQEENA
ncbi:sugar ABC transporter ATP-binding protein [Williamsia sp.]|uniref:sugar ABC transporter ATP-binding protein n=1 Tax=Williamsia sp. TaxID=1872085 RepID=UPI002F95B065